MLLQKTTWMDFILPLKFPRLHLEAMSWCHPAGTFLVQTVAVHTTAVWGPLLPSLLRWEVLPSPPAQ